MESMTPQTPKLTPALLAALAGVAEFSDGYYWKPAAMKKLEALGLVEMRPARHGRGHAHFLTEAGRAALQSKGAPR